MQIKSAKTTLIAAIEALEGRQLLSTYLVTTTADTGAGSLRQAIMDANNHKGADTIHFAIGSGSKTIKPSTGLPSLGDGTTLDATSQPGYAGKPLIVIDGANAGSADGLKITGSGVVVRGLVIDHFGGSGILILGKGGNRIAGNYIGTDSSGSIDAGNHAHGIIIQSPSNTIGGTKASDRNVISGNDMAGVFVYTSAAHNNVILGNFIGTAASGLVKLGNSVTGVQINGGANNWIGAGAKGARNVISGNGTDGVLIVNAGSTLNVVQQNFIGTDATGEKALGNGRYGIEISQPNNVVGGTGRAGNLISGNGAAGVVLFLSSAYGNRVQGNSIGVDFSGTKDLGNKGRGVEFTNGAHDSRVGGDTAAERNVISGNDNGGVGFYSSSSMNVLTGNYIGTNSAGSGAIANTGAGVTVTDGAGTNFIGERHAGNLISGNSKEGVCLTSGTKGTVVWGNYIGTDATGKHKIANGADGIFVASSGNQIGGKKKGTGNLIAGNGGNAVSFVGSHGNLVSRNIVGVNVDGAALPNAKKNVIS